MHSFGRRGRYEYPGVSVLHDEGIIAGGVVARSLPVEPYESARAVSGESRKFIGNLSEIYLVIQLSIVLVGPCEQLSRTEQSVLSTGYMLFIANFCNTG